MENSHSGFAAIGALLIAQLKGLWTQRAGVTFEYEAGEKPVAKEDVLKNKKGKVEITYQGYEINKGFSDAVF